MSAQVPKTLTEWLLNLPISWLVAGPNGKAEWTAWGSILDGQVTLIRAAVKARFPDFAPSDALPNLAGDRNLLVGPSESQSNFVIRAKTIWADATRAGTFLELLVQLYWAGFTGAVIVQQNGLAYNLTGAPTAGQDPTSLLAINPTDALTTALVSSVSPGRSIPAGTPWFAFDGDTDHCSRFAVLFPSPIPSVFRTQAVATFTATDNATVTWNNAFVDTTYVIAPGPAIVTDGGGPVFITADSTTKTTTGVTVRASAPFTGTCTVLAYQLGANPLADLHPADLARLRAIITTWRPNALCMGAFAIVAGEMWDFPLGLTWDGDSLLWDQPAASVAQFLGVF